MGYYGQAYNIYSYVLNVFTAGFPFAVATLVARYTVLKDAKTVLLVKKISLSFLAVTGFIGMLILMASAGFLAPLMVEEDPENYGQCHSYSFSCYLFSSCSIGL